MENIEPIMLGRLRDLLSIYLSEDEFNLDIIAKHFLDMYRDFEIWEA